MVIFPSIFFVLFQQVTNSETMNLDRIEESFKTPDERKTSVNNESCNSSVKASEKIDLSQDHVKAISER